MDRLLYFVALGLIRFLQALPLRWVARIGRCGGGLAYRLDARHRHVALQNLILCFGAEKSAEEIRALARENFKRIGESYGCAIKTAAMSHQEIRRHFELFGAEKMLARQAQNPRQNWVMAIGHFGNFELYARLGQFASAFRGATTYRGLKQASLNRLMQSLRQRSGCLFFERRSEGAALKALLNDGKGLVLGLLVDQHAGSGGLWVPFFGHECSTSTSPAVYALRYKCVLNSGVIYRAGLARWRMDVGDEIPTHENGQPRSVEAITRDINRALEAAIRRDPANWFWVHKRWKPKPQQTPSSPKAEPESGLKPVQDAG